MFVHLRPAQLDRAQWDDLVTQAPNGLIYALSWYLDIVSPGWEALVRVEDGRYMAGLPLPVRVRFGLRYLQQPPYAQQLGLFARQPPTPADWQQIGQLLRHQFRVITRYSFNTGNAELLNADAGPNPLGIAGTVARTFYLSLQLVHAQLLAGY